MSQTTNTITEKTADTADLIGTVIFTCVVFAALGIFVLVLLFAYQKKYIKHLKEQEKLKLDNERNILNAQIEVKEQTLKDTGAELHDNVGQLLSLAKLQLVKCTADNIENTKDLIQTAIVEVRELSHRLNLDWANDASLFELIGLEIQKLEKVGYFEISQHFTSQEFQFKKEHKILLLRCVQETIQNILKHSEATKIDFKSTLENQQLILKIEDNGKGFDVVSVQKAAGLTNMTERMKTVGGEFEITSIKGTGTISIFKAPVG